ncbi:PEGA domain-containing protein [Pseudomonas nitroreducens]|uniref:PEGA domain-containing protein n=1 Tax=Pseudomonas nitroreducens TaxID=46680 RepID=UPI00209E1769|nr:PEGA domain-containing protein [Pseudomonas nitroreducens]MCP1622538.1 cytoskeletal protein RodZ [Pseudomonas nitroreducens]
MVGVAACALLLALWKAGTFDNTVVTPANHEASPQPSAGTQPTDSPVESTVTVTQEPMDDEPALAPSSAPAADEPPAPAAHDRQHFSDTVRQTEPAAQSVAPPAHAPATRPSPAAVSAQMPAEHQQPKTTSRALTEPKVRPAPRDALTITGTKPASPSKPRSAPAPAAVGTLIVSVQPWAEVWIDGDKRGISPPLLKLQLPPGVYTVELRNPALPSYSQKVQIGSGQSVTLRHRFP